MLGGTLLNLVLDLRGVSMEPALCAAILAPAAAAAVRADLN